MCWKCGNNVEFETISRNSECPVCHADRRDPGHRDGPCHVYARVQPFRPARRPVQHAIRNTGRGCDHLKRKSRGAGGYICSGYGTKMHRMLQFLDQFPEGVRFTRPQGGLFIWAELPEGVDAVKLLSKAVERKVAYVPGTYFCADGGHLNTLRLNFSNSSPEQIETGMSVLNDLIKSEI